MPCMGYRRVAADGSFLPYSWYTFTEINVRIKNFGGGLVNLNLVPPAVDNLKMIAHFMKNRMEWNISEHACNSHSYIVVPMCKSSS